MPCIGLVTASPLAAAPAFLPAARLGFLAPPAAAGGQATEAAGERRPRAAGRRPRRSTRLPLGRLVGLGGVAGVRRDLVVEVGLDPRRVDAERPSPSPMNAGSSTTARVERDDRRHAVDHELRQRAPRALQRLRAVAAGHDQLGDQGVEGAGDGLAGVVAAVEPDARAARRAPSADSVPGAGMKLRPASSALMRNSIEWPRDLGVVVAELLAGGDAEHLAHQVDAGDLLGDRVLDLQPGVDLEEGDRAVLADQELAGAGADVARLAQDRLGRRRRGVAICSSVRNGAGASSTSFWWRRCSEQSRVETTTTLPCWSARHWVSTWRGWSRNCSTKHSPRPNALTASRTADS